MFHSVIIPQRDYNPYLRHCLWSIDRSAKLCGVTDYEILVVDQGSRNVFWLVKPTAAEPEHIRVIQQPHSEYFNKPRAQNAGIEAATGDVFSFLDADTLVGPKWMECVERLDRIGPMALTKLCYRVRYLPGGALQELHCWALDEEGPGERTGRGPQVKRWFSRYRDFTRSKEHYRLPHEDANDVKADGKHWDGDEPPAEPVFGNSQFSIRREVLGGLRFDEAFQGRGFEDLWMNRAIWKRDEAGYRAGIVTDPDHALLQIRNPYPQDAKARELWGEGQQNKANFNRYFST